MISVDARIRQNMNGQMVASVGVHDIEPREVRGMYLKDSRSGAVRIGETVILYGEPLALATALRDAADQIEYELREKLLTEAAAEHGDEILEAAEGVQFYTLTELYDKLEKV